MLKKQYYKKIRSSFSKVRRRLPLSNNKEFEAMNTISNCEEKKQIKVDIEGILSKV